MVNIVKNPINIKIYYARGRRATDPMCGFSCIPFFPIHTFFMSVSDSYHTDIDECSTGLHNCIGSTCENIPGSFSCQCKSKFTRKDATTCEGSCIFLNFLPHISSHYLCGRGDVGIFHYIDNNLNP